MTLDMIQPEEKFLPSCDPMKADMYFQNAVVEQTYQRHLTFQKGRTKKKKGLRGPKNVQTLVRQIALDLKV